MRSITKVIVTTFLLLNAGQACGQLQNIINKAKDKAKQIRNGSSPADTVKKAASNTAAAAPDNSFDFIAGDSILFTENLATANIGSMPASLKTNGGGKVIVIPQLGVKWLQLNDGSSYKIKRLLNLPQKFTVEFVVVAMADQTIDLGPLIFGFTADNSLGSYIQDPYNNNGICTVTLLYFNRTGVTVSSSKTKVYFNTSFGLTSYANRVMHVSIAVTGDEMTVYLDKTKISDSELFKSDPSRYLFISAPLNSKNNAKIALGNIIIKGFKH